MREGIADIVLEEGHKQRVHDGDVERANTNERDVELLVLQLPAFCRHAAS